MSRGVHDGDVDRSRLSFPASMASGAHAPVPTISTLAGESGRSSSRRMVLTLNAARVRGIGQQGNR